MPIIIAFTTCRGIKQAQRISSYIQSGEINVEADIDGSSTLELIYTGCSGFVIQDSIRGVCVDPFFSNPGPLFLTNIKKLKPDTAEIEYFFQSLKTNSIDNLKLLLNTHTHYDHALDIPYLYHRKLVKDSLIVCGNRSLLHLLEASAEEYGSHFDANSFIVGDSLANQPPAFQWLYARDSLVRIMPIRADHGPQFHGIRFYRGEVSKKISRLPKKARKWKEGQVLTYLIDFLKDNRPVFRIYINGAPNSGQNGLPSEHELKSKKIDLAIICAASSQYTKGYPEKLMEYLKPEYVVLSHWENFFQPLEKHRQKSYAVPFSNIPKFIKGFESIMDSSRFILPKPYSKINIRY